MRVITGIARGRKLSTPEGLDVRPTTDKVKESMFNIVQFDLPGSKVLDLFAGSGQLGIEALSRGAAYCTFVDSSAYSLTFVKDNLEHTGLMNHGAVVKNEDCISFLQKSKDTFDVAFLDPPYRKQMMNAVLPLLAPRMSDQGVIVCESAIEEELPKEAGNLAIYREYNYGKIKLTVYRVKEDEDA